MADRSFLRVIMAGIILSAAVPAQAADARYLYRLHCSGCHGLEGGGHPEAGVPFLGNSIARIVSHPDGKRYLMSVPGVRNSFATDAELSEILEYVVNVLGKERNEPELQISEQEIGLLRAATLESAPAIRRRISADLKGVGVSISKYPF